MKNLKVEIVYRDRNLNPTAEKIYDLRDYTDAFRMDLLKILSDVEDLVYIANDGRSKGEWNDAVWLAYQKIRHKILDKAGAIARLPDDIWDGDNNGDTQMDYQ